MEHNKTVLPFHTFYEMVNATAHFLLLDGYSNDLAKNYVEAERIVGLEYETDATTDKSICIVCQTYFKKYDDQFTLCQGETHPICISCLQSIYKTLFVAPGSIVNFNILKCPCCRTFNITNLKSTRYSSVTFRNVMSRLLTSLKNIFNKKFPYSLSFWDIDKQNVAVCKRCNIISVHSNISCAQSLEETNFICITCKPRFSRVVMCSICDVPVIKILNGECNHINNTQQCGHHVCAYKGCGEAFDKEDDCYYHMEKMNHEDEVSDMLQDEDMHLSDNYVTAQIKI